MISGFLFLGLLLIGSAFFSGSETAFFTLSSVDLVEIENSEYRNRDILLKLISKRDKLLTTILIGNNIVNIAASALTTKLAIQYTPILGFAEEYTITLFAAILTVIVLFSGEIVPKSIAMIYNRQLSLFFAPIMYFLSIVLQPISFIFDRGSLLIKKLLSSTKDRHGEITESTVINVVNKGQQLGVINNTEKDLIENVFLFDEREVDSVMTPRTKSFTLSDSLTIEEAIDEILDRRFTRIPLYSKNIDNITGILNVKKVMNELLRGDRKKKLSELAHKPFFVYETLPLSSLLKQFKTQRNLLAIVVDEFGGVAGLITMEDILEELVGEIFDEKDEVIQEIKQIGEFKWLIKGRTDIIAINKRIKGIKSRIEEEEDYDTLQGFIMSSLERIPSVGDILTVDFLKFTVMRMHGNEIQLVMVEYLKKTKEESKK
ncbi:MAG: putative hemolysin [bacterium]